MKKYESMVHIIYHDCKTMNKLFTILKHQGLCQKTVEDCEDVLKNNIVSDFFHEGVSKYLERNITKIEKKQPLICTSDIIESFFGKLKNNLS